MTHELAIPEEVEDILASEPADESSRLTPFQESLVFQYYPLVWVVAREIVDTGDLDDAAGDGSRALVIAATKYDPSRRNHLSTTGSKYFTDCIKGGILKGMRTMRGRSENGGVENNKPGVMTGTARSLDAPVSAAEGARPLGEIVAAPDRQDDLTLALFGTDLRRALETVSDRDRAIFLRCVVDDQMDIVAEEEFGLHKSNIGRIKKRVAKHVRQVLADYSYNSPA